MKMGQSREQKAEELLRKGHDAQRLGNLPEALNLFQRSIQILPTVEAHISLGWSYNFLHRYEDAIDECRRAIAINPNFGDPYNNIGLYLMKLGKLEDAVPRLEQAKEAPDYKTPHYPYLNLGRIALMKGHLLRAAREFGSALEIQPASLTARRTLAAVSAQLN